MGCSSSKHALDEAERVRAASNPTTNVAAISLVNLPQGINILVAECLDPTSLAHFGTTCSSLNQLVFHDVDWKWKECHDETWSCGKRSRLDCLPSQRPRSKIAIDLGGMSWREEFARRANLDKMVPALLKGDPAVFLQFVEDNQSDIFNKLVASPPKILQRRRIVWSSSTTPLRG